ncbi:PAS domain S-box protein [Comamonas sp. NLF-1-9]|uniref:PAS domain-containing protein n=1 Tax=Comamonas sp. NLF-1-9 TaxID=2853163 RepID=UPI001C46FEBB|nr:PAS domain S-box protein [Comamonas sp. NLF-1-9]QXL84197.1 PAS domain S-box protein [Comamonas sp. NLF-1-9]
MHSTDVSTPPWERIALDLGDALIFIDTEGRIRVWNAMAAALFGFSAEEALGQSVDLIIPAHLREAHWRGFRHAIAAGHTTSREVRTTRGVHKQGRKLYVDMSFAIVCDEEGQALGSAAIARDATERYLAQLAARQQQAG